MAFDNEEQREWVIELSDTEVASLQNAFLRGDDEEERNPHVIKHFVGFAAGCVKVEIFSNEDPPPHFRVLYQGSSANYRIADCSRRDGSGQVLRFEKKIKRWWVSNKQHLICKWNCTRPEACPVGKTECSICDLRGECKTVV